MKAKLLKAFEQAFNASGDIHYYFAPGRVNLIGEHTDYNGGHVFPCALTIGTYLAARKRDDRTVRFYSANFESLGVVTCSLDDLNCKPEYNWANYPLGVMWAFMEKGHKIETGYDIAIIGNIPNGSGLSSSASLEVVTGTMLKDMEGLSDVSGIDVALYGQYSENNFNGCNCGIMDQFASAMGQTDCAIFLDTEDLSYTYAPIKLDGVRIVVTNSNVKHSLVGSEYNVRRAQCEAALADLQTVLDIPSLGALSIETFEANKSVIKEEINAIRAKHAVYENQRTIQAVDALAKGDITTFGTLMNASHVSLRDDYDVSCKEMDILAAKAWEIDGVIGSRMTGGGFGGCTVSLVKEEAIDNFKAVIAKSYTEATGITPDFYVVDIGNGASAI
ncbi:MAG: galactokinase [Lachnospiraceae bacterium]